MVFFGVESLRRALREYVAHYNAERPHQGIGNELIGLAGPPVLEGAVECDERLGGLLQHYRRAA